MIFRMFSFVVISTAGFLISACSPINSEFSCNATAGDSCMTIEQVDAMTRYADGTRAQNAHSVSQQKQDHHVHPLVWVAPRNDGRLNQLGAAQNPTLHAHG